MKDYELRGSIRQAVLSGNSNDIKQLLLSAVQVETLVCIGDRYMSVKKISELIDEPSKRIYIRLGKLYDSGYILRRRIEGGTKKGAIYLYYLTDETKKGLRI